MAATKLTAEQQAKKSSNELALRNAIVEGYLETGKCLDAKDIATRLKWSETKVRRVLDGAHGAPDGIHAHQEHRESHSKNYRSFQTGAHRTWVYAPALWLLRDMLNAERTKKLSLDTIVKEATDNVDALAEEFRLNTLIPLCTEHKLTYLAGNGNFAFYDEGNGGDSIWQDDDRISEVIERLNEECLGHNDLFGFHVGDITRADIGLEVKS